MGRRAGRASPWPLLGRHEARSQNKRGVPGGNLSWCPWERGPSQPRRAYRSEAQTIIRGTLRGLVLILWDTPNGKACSQAWAARLDHVTRRRVTAAEDNGRGRG